jgi:hypothetical protein
LFDGPDSNSNGGVYLVSAQWYLTHPGGTFNGQDWCGSPRFGWTARGGGAHQQFATSLRNNANLVRNGNIIATYQAEFTGGAQAGGLQQTWTPNEIRARTIQGDPNNCFIAIYDGGNSLSNGGIYQITPEWFTGHLGGPLQPFCGGLSFRWLTRFSNHNNWATNLVENTDIIRPGNMLVATYVGELDEGLGAQDQNQNIGLRSGCDQSTRTPLVASFVAACSLSYVLGQS